MTKISGCELSRICTSDSGIYAHRRIVFVFLFVNKSKQLEQKRDLIIGKQV